MNDLCRQWFWRFFFYYYPRQNELLLFNSYLTVPDSRYLPVLWQFRSSPNSPFLQISHFHKGIPMAVITADLEHSQFFKVNKAEIFMSPALKNNSFL